MYHDNDLLETGDWEVDNQRGRELAEQLLGRMREDYCPIYLGQVAKTMIERGRWGGMEVGFFHHVALMAM